MTSVSFFFLMIRRPPRSPLFPSTPLFRSEGRRRGVLLPRGWLFPGRNPIEPLSTRQLNRAVHAAAEAAGIRKRERLDRVAARDPKSTRLNSSHPIISYAVFCL